MLGISLGRRTSSRRLVFLGGFLAVGILISVTALAGHLPTNGQDDPRNTWESGQAFGVKSRGDPSKDCWRHHRGEGMEDSHIIIPIVPQAIKVGETYPVKVQVINGWKYYLSTLSVRVNVLENETYLRPIVGAALPEPQPVEFVERGLLVSPQASTLPPYQGQPSIERHNFTVPKGAASIEGSLQIDFTSDQVPNTFKAGWKSPQFPGSFYSWEEDTPANNSKPTRSFRIPTEIVGGTKVLPVDGVWQVLLEMEGPSPDAAYTLRIVTNFEKAGASNYTLFTRDRVPPGNSPSPAKVVDVGLDQTIEFEIEGIKPGTQTLEFVASADLYYDHLSTTIPDEDQFNRYRTIKIEVGDSYIPPLFEEATVTSSLKVPFYLAAAEITGFVGAFLLLPSLVLGGTYGRASRKFFNAVLGGAKRRVMFHNLLSMGLTIVAIVHVVFFLLEIRYTVLMGVLWGGLGALSLLGLGLTGFYQVPLIQRHGYNWWRYLHLVLGLVVCVFVAYHAVADGAHFVFLKEQLPAWLQKLNFVQA